MKRRHLTLAGLAGAGALATLHPLAGHAAECAQLSSLELPHTEITLAESVASGAFKPPAGIGAGAPGTPPAPYAHLPPFCRVAGTIRPTPDSDIRFEVWMPASSAQRWASRWPVRSLRASSGATTRPAKGVAATRSISHLSATRW